MSRHWIPLTLIFAVACDAQVDGDHKGEVLAEIEGSLTSMRAQPLPSPEVALVWSKLSLMNGIAAAEKVKAEGLFPQFTLSIHSPPPGDLLDPPDDWLAEWDGQHYGVGLVVVGNEGIDYKIRTDWRGVDFDRVVIYLPEDTVPGGMIEAFLHGPQTEGFHVYTVKRLTEAERQQRLDCVNMIPHQGRMLTYKEMYATCGGAGRDELYPATDDLQTLFDVEVIEDVGIVELINRLPRW
jgi:hypothetical protein